MLINRGGVEDIRLEAKAKDSPTEDRPSRVLGQECSRPRTKDTRASALQKKRLQKNLSLVISKKNLQKKILGDLEKKTFSKKFFRRSTNFQRLKK